MAGKRYEISMGLVDGFTPPLATNRASKLAASIIIDTTIYTWTDAIITLEWGIVDEGNDTDNIRDLKEKWNLFSNTIIFDITHQSRDRISVSSVPMVRFRVTTAEGSTGDPKAIILVHLS